MENIIIRKSNKNTDKKQLKSLLNTVFNPEKVGDLAEIFFDYLPGMKPEYWFLAEDKQTTNLVSSFTLIPWTWELEGVKLKIAEMGLVGTVESYRGKGLMKILNKEFDKTIDDEGFDLGVIQGIPGFYHKFGYYYALQMENHINVQLDQISEMAFDDRFNFRLASEKDISWLMDEEEKYRRQFSISVVRTRENWNYILNKGKETDYGSEMWIMEDKNSATKFYFRVQLQGFGTGLILNETSENIDETAYQCMFAFCKKLAKERSKPYIRINMHNDSATAKFANKIGAPACLSYAWQIKVPYKVQLLRKLVPVLERRLNASPYHIFEGILRFNFYQETIDITIGNGKIEKVAAGNEVECMNTFCINSDLFPLLILGHRTWSELQYVRPDIFPEPLYTNPVDGSNNISGHLVDVLFPKSKSWIYLQY